MQIRILLLVSFHALVFSLNVSAQSNSAFQTLLYPRSVTSSGLGEQGVASMNSVDAMQYNPANLIFSDNLSMSYFRNPLDFFLWSTPLTSFNAAARLPNGGVVGAEYTDWNFGNIPITTEQYPDGNGESYSPYERSLAVGYAMPLSAEFALGGQLRYVWSTFGIANTVDHVLFSLGANYRPAAFVDRFNLGLSFINFSTPVKYPSSTPSMQTFSDPSPAQINLGMNAVAVKNTFADVNFLIGVKKPIVKRTGFPDYNGESSFTALTSDWSDFPNDMTVQVGLNYLWHPVYLGAGVSFIQEMYLGYFSTGPKDGTNSFYTHGFTIGIETHGIKATAGYAGRWHNNNFNSYGDWNLPWETFQFGLSSDFSVIEKKSEEGAPPELPKNIIVSGGYLYGYSVGIMKSVSSDRADLSYASNSNWAIESDFYISDNAAILTSFTYSRMKETVTIQSSPLFDFPSFSQDIPMETMSLESGFRYHPIDAFHPLFVQVSLGIIRLNPVYEYTSPKYFYKTFDRIAAGFLVPVKGLNIAIMPKVGLRTIYMEAPFNGNRLSGYNQVELGLNAGYSF
jgi:hypothetical protein